MNFARPQKRRPRRCVGWIIGFAVATAQTSTLAASNLELERQGIWGGPTESVFIDGDLVYLSSGRKLSILDVTDDGTNVNISRLGFIDLDSYIYDVEVKDGYAYIAAGPPQFFTILDVSDPSQPTFVWAGMGENSPIPLKSVDLHQQYAYITERNGNLRVFDVSDPHAPTLGGPMLFSVANDVTFVGDLMYVGGDSQRFQIYDMSQGPFFPNQLAAIRLTEPPDISNDVQSITVAGNYAYLTTTGFFDDSTLYVVDVSDPHAPVSVETSNTFFDAEQVTVANGYAYVADWAGRGGSLTTRSLAKGLAIYDVTTDPTAPAFVNAIKTHGTIRSVESASNRLYALDDGEGLIVFDSTDPANPVRLGAFHAPANLRKLAKVGDQLYVSDDWNGFTSVDVSNPRDPTTNGVYQAAQDGIGNWGLKVQGGLAYLSAGWAGLEVADVTDPSKPTLVGSFSFDPGRSAVGLELDGAVVNIGIRRPFGNGILKNLDITDIASITELGSLNLDSPPLVIDSTVQGRTHVAMSGQTTINNANPANPIILHDSIIPQAVDVVRKGDFIYIADDRSENDGGGFYIQDVSDPANPVELWYHPALRGSGVALFNNRAFFIGQDPDNGLSFTLFAFDVSDPIEPRLMDKILTPGHIFGVLATASNVYVSSTVGLTVFKVKVTGDLNDDGLVNLFDVQPFVSCLLGEPEAPEHNELADLTGDGVVDGLDVQSFVNALCIGG